MIRSVTTASIALLAVLVPALLSGQAVTVDEGEFRISIGGRAVGTETFHIQRGAAGGPEQFRAVAVVELDSDGGPMTLQPELRLVGPNLADFAYQVTRTAGETTKVTVAFELPNSRVVATTESPEGSREKEYRWEEGILLLEDRVAHQYYFLSRVIESGARRIPAIVPLEGRRVELAISVAEDASLLIGGRTIPARRVTLGTGDLERRVWLDPQGRVLRVEVPSIGYEAMRTQPPT